MKLCFIDNNRPPDRRAQKILRSHALKGKNQGKRVVGRGHKGRQVETRSSAAKYKTSPCNLNATEVKRAILPPKAQYGAVVQGRFSKLSPSNALSGVGMYFMSLETTDTQSWYLFDQCRYIISEALYPPIFCGRTNEAQISLLKLLQNDACTLHIALATTSLYVSRQLGQKSSVQSVRHFTEAISLLRAKLNSSSVVDDATLAVIVALAIHSNQQRSASESRAHLQALRNIVESRPGGLAKLCETIPEIGNKIRRADLQLAIMTGTSTLLCGRPAPLPAPLLIVPILPGDTLQPLPPRLTQISPKLQSMFQDVMALCAYAGRAKLGAFQYQELIISIQQRLIDYFPISELRTLPLLDEVCQLTLLAFMSTMLCHDRQSRPIGSALLSRVLQNRLDQISTESCNGKRGVDPELIMWALFMHAISSPEFETLCSIHSVLAPTLSKAIEVLDLKIWEDVKRHLERYPWIATFHEQYGRQLFDSIILGGELHPAQKN